MNEQLLTLRYLKKITNGIIPLTENSLKYDDDYLITYQDFETEKFCKKYKKASRIKNSIDGVLIEGINHDVNDNIMIEDVSIVYCKFSSFIINSNKYEILPQGETLEITANGEYRIIKKSIFGVDIIDEKTENVNAIITCDDCDWFNLNENIAYVLENLTDNDRKIKLYAKYFFKSKMYTSQLILVQKANKINDWEFEKDETECIKAIGINSTIPKEGGKCVVLVKRYFTKFLIRKDLCGNIRNRKEENGCVEYVTNYCQFSITNGKYFQRIVNTIIAKKQELENDERICKVTVTYKDNYKDELIITQEKGGVIGYNYTLTFDNDEKLLMKNIDSSLKTEFNIPIKSYKNLTIDDKITSSIYTYDISCISDKGWCVPTIIEFDNSPHLNVKIVNGNQDKNNERVCDVTVYNNENVNDKITLKLTQSNNKITDVKYEIVSSGDATLTYDDIKNYKVFFSIKKTTVYEDESISNDLSLEDKTNKIICSYESTCPTIFDGQELVQVDFNGGFVMIPRHFGSTSISDIYLNIKSYVCDENLNKISDVNNIRLTLLGQDLITYEYDFKFDNDNLVYDEIFFDYDFLNGKELKVISTKNKYINGIKDSSYVIPFNYTFKNNNDNYKVFRKANSTLEIVPTSINLEKKEHTSTLELIQNESKKTLNISVIQDRLPDERYIDVHVIVDAFRDYCDDDIWADYDSKLIIKDSNNNIVKSILLNKWWISSEINYKHDVIFDGKIKLLENNNYTFEIKNIISKDIEDLHIEKHEFNKTYLIKYGKDINITLNV